MPLSDNDIESELSYAYLHAVSSIAGLNCQVLNRQSDNYCVDAQIDHFDHIPDTYVTDVTLRVQLKASIKKPREIGSHFIYHFKGIQQYNKLRTEKGLPHRILVVLFLPEIRDEWFTLSPTELVLKKAAYWVSLYGAEESDNDTGLNLYLPKENLLTPQSLKLLCRQIGLGNIPRYIKPEL